MMSAEIQGFVLTRQWYEHDGIQDLVFWLATDQGPIRVIARDADSIFFLTAEDAGLLPDSVRRLMRSMNAVQLTDFDRQPVVACYFATHLQLVTARKRLATLGMRCFEADIRPSDRFLMERFVTAAVSLSGGERQASDRSPTFVDPQLRPSDYRPSLRVVSIDIETSWKEQVLLSIAVSAGDKGLVFMKGDGPQVQDCDIRYCPDERKLIDAFLAWIDVYDPDVLIGWNVVGFDLWFLQQRCKAMGVSFALGRNHSRVVWRESQTNERRFAVVPGRVVLDGIELLRTATYSFTSFSLNAVSNELLGRGKQIEDVEQRADEILSLYANDRPALARYNLSDCRLVEAIFAHTELMQFAIERSQLTGLGMDRMGGSVAAFDYLYLPRLHRSGFVAPELVESGGGSPGGYVLDAAPGLYDNVLVLDFKSLYPSIIRTYHVDPLALVMGIDEPDAIPGFKGARFSRSHHLLPEIIATLWGARDKAKAQGRGAMSSAIKIIMNSFYGVLGTTACRFYAEQLASSITMRGHEILLRTRDLIEEQGYQVIYGDTDSVFVLLGPLDDDVSANDIGQSLATDMNRQWEEYLRNEFGLPCYLEVEYETHFGRFLMPTVRGSDVGSKKRYAGLRYVDGQPDTLVFKGLESVRSDWCSLAKTFQQELYRRVFEQEPVVDYVNEITESVLSGSKDSGLVLRKRIRRKLAEYQKNIPPHVRAARMADDMRERAGLPVRYDGGGWIEYMMTVNGPEPLPYVQSPVDYTFYLERQLWPVADAILSMQGMSMESLTEKQLGLF